MTHPVARSSSVKRNIIANYVGQGWSGVMSLVFIPYYIRYLGIEGYGLIGLFATLQAWLALLDMGMTPTLNREMARYTAGAHSVDSIADLLRTLEIVCYSVAALIALGLWFASGYIARDWLNSAHLPIGVVAGALSIIAVVIGFRFIEGLYRGALYGLQRQVWYNAVSAGLATIRHAGAVAVLAWLSPTIRAFFLWQVVISVISVVIFALSVHRTLPAASRRARFSTEALAGVWRFATGLMAITVLSILLTQVDKLLLSRLLTLETFGYYTLAASAAGVLYMVLGPVSQAVYPRLVQLVSTEDQTALSTIYHNAAQLITVLTAPIVVMLVLYSRGALILWSGNPQIAGHTANLLSALALGTFLNGLMWMPYQLQLAYGWTSLTLKANAIAVAVFVPALIWLVPRAGAKGAAWLWVVLNLFYVTTLLHVMHRQLLRREKWRWYGMDVVLPLIGASAVALAALPLAPVDGTRLNWLVFLVGTGSATTVGTILLANRVRPLLADRLRILNTLYRFQSGQRTR